MRVTFFKTSCATKITIKYIIFSARTTEPLHMKRQKLPLLILLFSLPFLQGVDCKRYEGMPDIPYQHYFKETVALLPYQTDYRVGDTIYLQVHIPGKKLLDTLTGTRVFFDSALFKSFAQAQLVYNNPFLGDGPFVQFLFPTGVSGSTNNYSYNTQALVDFGCAPGPDYSLSLGMVLLKRGVFGISFSTSSLAQCGTETYRNARITFLFDVADTHKSFYQTLPFDSIGKQPDAYVLDALDRKNMVVIRVL